MATCLFPAQNRRRLFWATQTSACGVTTDGCYNACGVPGLSYHDDPACGAPCNAAIDPECPPATVVTTRTIDTTDWIRGLVLNMLMTDGRKPDTPCGYAPSGIGGHWSESYIEGSDNTVGTMVRYAQPVGRVQDAVSAVVGFVESTLQRLVTRGVATSVDVTGKYVGGGLMNMEIVVYGSDNTRSRVGVQGARLAQGWIWE